MTIIKPIAHDKTHKLLLKGIALWKNKYNAEVHGLDTLCTHNNSRLFKDYGWKLVGKTAGFTSDLQKYSQKEHLEGLANCQE